MKNKLAFIPTLIIAVLFSCDKNNEPDSIGILQGTIGLYEGNCMPGPGVPPCEPSPISTTVAITEPSEHYHESLLVETTISASDGTFEISLTEGHYSLFILDGSEYICDFWTCPDDCYCTLFKITTDSVTIVNANIDHAVW